MLKLLFSRNAQKILATSQTLILVLLTFMVFGMSGKPARAIVITNAQVSGITSTTATITWTTDVVGDAEVAYIPFDAPATDTPQTVSVLTPSISHSVQLSGLLPLTKYVVAASSADAEGEIVWSQNMVFDTLSATGAGSNTNSTTTDTTTTNTTTNQTNTTSTTGSALQYTDLLAGQASTGLQYNTEQTQQQYLEALSATGSQIIGGGKYPTGTLAVDGYVVYFLMQKDSVKIPFTAWEVFVSLGYEQRDIQKGLDLSGYKTAVSYFLSSPGQEHPWGSCLKWKDGTVFYSHPTGMIGIPSMEVLSSIGCRVQNMNQADEAIWAANPNLPVMMIGDGRVL